MSGAGSARDEILGSIRANLAGVESVDLPPERGLEQGAPAKRGDPAEHFREVLERVDGVVHRVRDEAEAGAVLRRIATERGAQSVLISDDERVARLAAATQLESVPSDAARERQLEADLGLTGAQWGIAETGTLVLVSDLERHRLASLLPETHVAVLEASAILPALGDALAAVEKDDLAGRTVTFVTGPSRTADIELTLVVGVHGPRELHVLLIDP